MGLNVIYRNSQGSGAMNLNELKQEVSDRSDPAIKDVNDLAAEKLRFMRDEIESLVQSAKAMPKEASVALENVMDCLFRSAEAIGVHPMALDGVTQRDVAK
jgi:hypothetical protein